MKYCNNPDCTLYNYPLSEEQNYCTNGCGRLRDALACPCGSELVGSDVCCGKCGLTRDQIKEEKAEQDHLENEENRATGN